MRLLLVSDFVIHSGFARVGEALARELTALGWDISVLAVNYRGDPTPLQQQYRLFPAATVENAGDLTGTKRLAGVVNIEQPDTILVVGDPWHACGYLAELARMDEAPPAVLYTPVDAESLRSGDVRPLNGYHQTIAYTAFGRHELRRAGLETACHIIPHGIDLEVFHPINRHEARGLVGLPDDLFMVLVLDRNQVRKRLDIAFDAFARFAEGKPDTVVLVYHGALDDDGWDIRDMARDLGITRRMIYPKEDIRPLLGIEHDQLSVLYSMCDIKLSTTSGEGWGMTTMEAMACGLPNIVPDFAALGEWARDAALTLPAPIRTRHSRINTVGRVPDTEDVRAALESLYHDHVGRLELSEAALALVNRPEYRWSAIAAHFDRVLTAAANHEPPVAEIDARPVCEVVYA